MVDKNQEPFVVKRGMVFFLEDIGTNQPFRCINEHTYEKKRPYIVLSNDKCNEHSPLIHVAPIVTREPSSVRPYQIPFKSKDGRNCIVDIAAIMLIPKDLCNSVTYSPSVTHYTIDNKELLVNIETAITRQFSLCTDTIYPDDADINKKEEIKSESTPEIKIIEKKEEKEMNPTIILNININGMPVQMKSVEANDGTITLDVNSSNIIEETQKKKSTKKAENKCKNNEERTNKKEFIKKNYRGFGGTMTYRELATKLGTTIGNISYYVKKISLSQSKTNKKRTKYFIPESMEEQMLKDFESYGATYVMKKYNEIGFSSSKACWAKMKALKNKRQKIVK